MKRACRPSTSFVRTLHVRVALALCAATAAHANAPDFDLSAKRAAFADYQSILDRMPFGPLPPNFGEAPPAEAPAQTDAQTLVEQQKLAQQINMSCINVTPDGSTAIGFTDLGAKPPVNFYLLVGATAGGWTVLKADYDGEWAQIEKDGVTITLKLGKGLIDGPPAETAVAQNAPAPSSVAPAAEEAASSVPAPPRLGLIRRPSQPLMPPMPGLTSQQRMEAEQARAELAKIREAGGDVGSYMDRLRERKAQVKAEQADAEKAARENLKELARKITEDELRKREREINLNLIEQGAKPVSDIELTPEEEEYFVQKGLLTQ